MDPRDYLIEALVSRYGSISQAAKAMVIPYPTLAATCNGIRGCSPNLARRLGAASGGFLDPSRLVWMRALTAEQRESRKSQPTQAA